MTARRGHNPEIGFWFCYAIVDGVAFGMWRMDFFAGLFVAMLVWPLFVVADLYTQSRAQDGSHP